MSIDAGMEISDCCENFDEANYYSLSFFQTLTAEVDRAALSAMNLAGNQFPLCLNKHFAVYQAVIPTSGGFKFYRYLCQHNGCDYEYHNYIKFFLPPGYRVIKIDKKK